MKKLILSIIFAGFALINAEAACCEEQNNWYLQANGSFGWHNKSSFSYKGKKATERQDSGYGGSFAIGRIIENWRLELEASHRENSSKSRIYTSNTSLMLNAYYDIPVMEDVCLYIGAGAGISAVMGKAGILDFGGIGVQYTERSRRDTVFAAQFMAGVSYTLSENWDLIAGYRLFGTAKPSFSVNDGSKVKMTDIPLSNSVELGLRFKF